MKKAILKDNRDFQRLYRRGNKAVSGTLVLYWLPGPTPCTRVGVYAGKKALGHAVVRNKMKRRVREAVRSLGERVPDGLDMVIVVRHAAIEKTSQEMCADFENLLRSCGLLCQNQNRAGNERP